MKFIDLCAGIGGFSLGLEWAGMECVGQIEIDDFCNKVLEKHWPNVKRWRDVKDESIADQFGTVDLICGGYPCQPFSVSGKRKGKDDSRHVWPFIFKILRKVKPRWCLFENVDGHIEMGLEEVCSDLESIGYEVQPVVIPACAVEAWHQRNRVWIIANIYRSWELQSERIEQKHRERINNLVEVDADFDCERREKQYIPTINEKKGCNYR